MAENGAKAIPTADEQAKAERGEWSLVQYWVRIPSHLFGSHPRYEPRAILVTGWIVHPMTIEQMSAQLADMERQKFMQEWQAEPQLAHQVARGIAVTITGFSSPDLQAVAIYQALKKDALKAEALAQRKGEPVDATMVKGPRVMPDVVPIAEGDADFPEPANDTPA